MDMTRPKYGTRKERKSQKNVISLNSKISIQKVEINLPFNSPFIRFETLK
jgi:hypothetical protein